MNPELIATVSTSLIVVAVAGGAGLALLDFRRTATDATEPETWTDPADAEPINWVEWTDQHTGRQEACSCGGRRCANRGLHCPGQRINLHTTTLSVGSGLHEPLTVLRRIVPAAWSPLAPHVRAFLAPSIHTPIINGIRRVDAAEVPA